MAESAQGHLIRHLRDLHALEVQALRQLARAAEASAGAAGEAVYREHLEQTRAHEAKIRELLEAHDRPATAVVDKTFRAGVIGLRQLADIPPNTPVKLATHMYGLEQLEIAAYELLAEIAKRSDDEDVAGAANEILEQECEAAEKIADTFDQAAEALAERDEEAKTTLLDHLCDAHALEQQSLQMWKTAIDDICRDEELKRVYGDQLEQTHEHERLVNERIEAHDAKPSAVRDLHMGTATSGLHDLAEDPPDTAVKLAMNFFCLAHIEVATYEFLIRIADAADDSETADAAKRILEQERQAAEAIRGTFERSVELMLERDPSYQEMTAMEGSPQAEG